MRKFCPLRFCPQNLMPILLNLYLFRFSVRQVDIFCESRFSIFGPPATDKRRKIKCENIGNAWIVFHFYINKIRFFFQLQLAQYDCPLQSRMIDTIQNKPKKAGKKYSIEGYTFYTCIEWTIYIAHCSSHIVHQHCRLFLFLFFYSTRAWVSAHLHVYMMWCVCVKGFAAFIHIGYYKLYWVSTPHRRCADNQLLRNIYIRNESVCNTGILPGHMNELYTVK